MHLNWDAIRELMAKSPVIDPSFPQMGIRGGPIRDPGLIRDESVIKDL